MRKNMKMRWKRMFALFLAVMLLFTSSGIESMGIPVYAAEEAASAVTEVPAEGNTTEPKEPTEPEAPTDPEQPTDPEIRITVRTAGEHIAFSLDAEDGSYASGSKVRVQAAAEEGYILLPEDIGAADADGNGVELQTEVQEDGRILITFTAGEKDVEISAAARKLRTAQIVSQDMEGNATDKLSAQTSPQALYEGAEVSVAVHYSGEQIWSAAVSDAEGNEIASVTDGETVAFTMPDSDVTIFLAELEDRNQGDLSAEDSEITGDWQGNTSNTAKENEPDIELRKSARWTDIEDGYAELTITEKDTSDYSNIPVDYIIVMDRTRTMALNDFKVRRDYPVGCRVELVRMDDEQAPPIGTKGTVRGVDDTASIMVRWDTGSGLNVVYGVDFCRKLDAVQITCYGKTEIWDSRKEAADFYPRAIAGSEGSECERYTKIYTELLMGKEVCSDEY